MRNTKAFTLTELIIVVVVIVVLALLLMPAFPPSSHKARQISCLSNLKQLGLAMLQYEQDNDNRLPLRQTTGATGQLLSWRSEIYPYVKSVGVYRCPSNPAADWDDIEHDTFHRSYAVNSSTGGPFNDAHPALSVNKIPSTATTIEMVESTAAFNDFNPLFPAAFAQPARVGWRTGHLYCGHEGDTNVLFIDGHAKIVKPLATQAIHTTAFDFGRTVNGWTIDGSPFSSADQATATSTIQFGIAMGKDK